MSFDPSMRVKGLVLGMAAFVGLFLAVGPWLGGRAYHDYFGPMAWTVVERADRAVAYRLDGSSWERGWALMEHTVGAPVALNDVGRKRLRTALHDPANFPRRDPTTCMPTPGVAVRFLDGEGAADLLICFRCHTMSLAVPEDGARWRMMPAAAETRYLEIVKGLFPNDRELQALR
jgi:hypothetical protein